MAVDLTEVLQVLRKVPIFSIDFETGGFDPLKHRITWISLSAGDDLSWAIPFVGPNAFNFVRTMTLLDPFLRAPEKEKVLHNAKFDLKFARRAELDFGGQLIDTCIASFLLDENRSSHALDVLVKEHFGYEMGKYEAVGGLFEGTTMMEGYSRDDAEWTLKLWKKLKPMLKRERLLRMFMELECEVVPVLADMELAGVAVDVDYMEGLRDYMAKAVDRLALQSFDVAGMTFDINSSQEVSELLYGKFNVRPPKRTRIDVVEGRKKWLSTEKEVLEQVSEQHPVIEVILEYRKFQKLLGTYCGPLPRKAREVDGRIRAQFRQIESKHASGKAPLTGRLSCSDPNLQNIPARTEEGQKIRLGFMAPAKRTFICADYSQVELRVLTHFSMDPALLEAYTRWDCAACEATGSTVVPLHACPSCQAPEGKRDKDTQKPLSNFCLGLDMHQQTATTCGVTRRDGKECNFSLIFGMGDCKFSRKIKKTIEEAREIKRKFFEGLAGVTALHQDIGVLISRDGYVTTLLGRRRRFPKQKGQKPDVGGSSWRKATSAIIQGSAAEIVKLAMRNLYRVFRERGWSELVFQVLSVHDEVVIELPEDMVKEVVPVVREVMEAVIQLKVPLIVDIGVSDRWGEAKA